jgi:hypothetical protein
MYKLKTTLAFFLLVMVTLFLAAHLSFAASEDVGVAGITIGANRGGTPFILDTKGDVWAFSQPFDLSGLIKLPNLHHIKKIAGYMALSEDGHVYTWALGEKSEAPSEDQLNAIYTNPKQVTDLHDVSDIASSGYHYVALKGHNFVYEWDGDFSQAKNPVLRPKLVYTGENIRAVATSNRTTLALVSDKTIIGWGWNQHAQLGSNDPSFVSSDDPRTIDAPETITKIYVTSLHTIALSNIGHVYYWGDCNQVLGLKPEGIIAKRGPVDHVVDMSAEILEDDGYPQVFIKKDGSVWLAYAPSPENIKQCQSLSPIDSFKTPSYQLQGGAIKATAATIVNNPGTPYSILLLGADHSLWAADARNPNQGISETFVDLNYKLKK